MECHKSGRIKMRRLRSTRGKAIKLFELKCLKIFRTGVEHGGKPVMGKIIVANLVPGWTLFERWLNRDSLYLFSTFPPQWVHLLVWKGGLNGQEYPRIQAKNPCSVTVQSTFNWEPSGRDKGKRIVSGPEAGVIWTNREGLYFNYLIPGPNRK